MRNRCNKQALTLIEILIVVSLIGVAFAALALPIKRALDGEKFERGVELVTARLNLAYQVGLDLQTDVRLSFYPCEKGIDSHLETDLILPPHLEKALNRYQTIPGIQGVFFNGTENPTLAFKTEFSAGPRGQLTLKGHGREASLLLKGYPGKILRGQDDPTPEREVPYPEEILFAI